MKHSIRLFASLCMAGITLGVASPACAANLSTLSIQSIDGIVGIRQDSAPQAGYNVDMNSGLVGGAGSTTTSTRYSMVPVIGFPLPVLPAGHTVDSVTIHYKIPLTTLKVGDHFDAHVYLLNTADPSGSGSSYFYQGPSDPNTDANFVSETQIPVDTSGTNITHNPPLVGLDTLTGDALSVFSGFYSGNSPTQAEAFFRFNRTTADVTDPTDNGIYNRYYIDLDPTNLWLEITTVGPESGVVWYGEDIINIMTSSAQAIATVSTNLDSTLLFWDTSNKGTDTNLWTGGSVNLGNRDAGSITGLVSSLSADTAYVARFYGEAGTTNGWSDPIAFTTALSGTQKPMFTNAAALSTSSIKLNWQDNAANETGYILQRSTTLGSGYATIETLAQNVTTYEDSGLTAGTTYYYQLAATNSINGSTTAFADCRTSATTVQASWASATGGFMYEEKIDGTKWQIHVFTNIGTYANGLVITKPGDVEYLIVAGGGGGGAARSSYSAGGGGAGGLLKGIANLSSAAYDIVVGNGGPRGTSISVNGSNGGNSSAFGLLALGGGGGASISFKNGNDGGSGGGGTREGTGGSATTGQGYGGGVGSGTTTVTAGGGGGGAGGAGGTPGGGAGVSSDIIGTSVTYAAGGNGGNPALGNNVPAAPGIANTGQGGGGSYSQNGVTALAGGAGGSGIVIVRYQLPPAGTLISFQ